MMEVLHFRDFSNAAFYVMTEDDEHIAVWHELEKGDEVKEHHHPKANEWTIIKDGIFVISIDGGTKELNLINNPTVIHFPPGSKHGIKAYSDIRYLAIKNKDDRTIFD